MVQARIIFKFGDPCLEDDIVIDVKPELAMRRGSFVTRRGEQAFYNVNFSEKSISVQTLYPSDWKKDRRFHCVVMAIGMKGEIITALMSENVHMSVSEVKKLLHQSYNLDEVEEVINWNYELVNVTRMNV